MKLTKKLTILAGAIALVTATQAATLVSSGTTFNTTQNTNVVRVGENASGGTFFTGWYVFDISADAGMTTGTLDFELADFVGGAANNDLVVDFVGTFAAANSTVSFANSGVWNAGTVTPVFSGAGAAGPVSFPVSGIAGPNDFAVFRITDPTPNNAQWDLSDISPGGAPGGGTFTIPTTVPTLTLVPEPSSVALLGLGGLALVARRKR